MSMIEPIADTNGLPKSFDAQSEKIQIVSCPSPEAATFSIKDEDHTLGNALRHMIMKKYIFINSSFSPHVEFCGYSIPHPSEYKIHLRIQTDAAITAADALNQGLNDLQELCLHVKQVFNKALVDHV
jgi:DNA-directed RNA polymerase I and III subunit RPAC2